MLAPSESGLDWGGRQEVAGGVDKSVEEKQQQQRHKQPNSSWLTSDFENKVEYVDLLTNTKLPIKIVFTMTADPRQSTQ